MNQQKLDEHPLRIVVDALESVDGLTFVLTVVDGQWERTDLFLSCTLSMF